MNKLKKDVFLKMIPFLTSIFVSLWLYGYIDTNHEHSTFTLKDILCVVLIPFITAVWNLPFLTKIRG